MHTRNLSRTRTRSASSAQAIQLNWQYVLLVLVCGAVVAAGFFFAARQHFMSMDYGFKNSKLKKQLEDLEAEKRRLVLSREISLSPTEIRKAASKAAMRAGGDTKAVLAAVAAARPVAGSETKLASPNGSPNSPKIVRTAFVRPADRSNPTDTHVKTAELNDKNGGFEIAAVAKLR
jgi:hypothetical protein